MNTPRLVITRPDGKTTESSWTATSPRSAAQRMPVRLEGTDVSRDHADITVEARGFVLRDKGSRFGTFVNGKQVTEHVLSHKDQIRLGQSSECEIVFVAGGAPSDTAPCRRRATSARSRRCSRACGPWGPAGVLDDVLTMVIDSAIEVTGAERGFIMLAGADSTLDFKMGRGRGASRLPGRTFETSRKIPDEVFATGEARILDFTDAMQAQAHSATIFLGIRHVLCVPLVLVRYVEQAEATSARDGSGVLYLDSRESGCSSLRPRAGRSRRWRARRRSPSRTLGSIARRARSPPRAGAADCRRNPAGP